MNEVAHNLERLGLSQYLDNFVEEGFDTWDTVLYITESDLDALNVKLGHRRKLQREIAHARGITFDQLLAQSNTSAIPTSANNAIGGANAGGGHAEGPAGPPPGPTKRKYRRHPKPDEYAPERPPSAYVIFSNQIREELKPQKLSFTAIAKTVGERWQALGSEAKEPFETRANNAKDSYNREMAKYKKTPHYREYMQYLADFRAKNAGSSNEGKRPRLMKELSGTSSGSDLHAGRPSWSHVDSSSGAGSPIEGGVDAAFPSNARQPPPPTPASALSASSASSTSPTSNLPPGGPPPPIPASSPPAADGARPPTLPRIIPLETYHGSISQPQPIISPPPLVTEPLPISRVNVRRTTGTPTPAFIRQDTSKSSRSSNISGGSPVSSAGFTPITPIEEGDTRRQSYGMHPGPTLPPITQSTGPPMGLYASSPSPGYTTSTMAPMKRLSLDDNGLSDRSAQYPRSNPPDPVPQEAHFSPHSPYAQHHHRPSSHHQHPPGALERPVIPLYPEPEREQERERERERPRDRDRERERLDPLSVLALAGNIVDRRPGQREP